MANWRENKTLHVVLVLVVFSCTGLTVARLGAVIAEAVGLERFSFLWWMMWIVALLPIYNVFLLIYAWIFGKYTFFRAKQKKMISRMMFWKKKQKP
ncbi:MAG: DUF6787 family protein [Bacteroidota bacterium]